MLRRKVEGPKRPRDVLWPVLYSASEHIDDEFWKNFFVDMSKGKLARKIHIDARMVSHNGKKASFHYSYEDKAPEEVAVELKKVISNTMCIYSETDVVGEKEQLDQLALEFKEAKTEDDWKKLKNRKMKDHLITNFVIAQKAKYNMGWPVARQVYQTINNALNSYRTHKSADITMVNGEITEIDGITITATGAVNHRFEVLDVEKEKAPVKKITFGKEWVKYCTATVKRARHLLCLEQEEVKKRVKKPEKEKKPPVVKKKGKALVKVEEPTPSVSSSEDDDALASSEEEEDEDILSDDGVSVSSSDAEEHNGNDEDTSSEEEEEAVEEEHE